ncbi:MAG: Lrp/AsnC family transcriptional regulator [Anaerolineae bacterium]
MAEYSESFGLDELDKAILHALQADGRISNAELARRINLSPPATHARVKRLEEQRYIRQYTALLDRDKAGYDMLCFVNVSLRIHQPEAVAKFRAIVSEMPEVLECYHITGEFDYVLKVIVPNRKALEQFVVGRLTPVPGIARIYTSIALAEVKSTTALPLE